MNAQKWAGVEWNKWNSSPTPGTPRCRVVSFMAAEAAVVGFHAYQILEASTFRVEVTGAPRTISSAETSPNPTRFETARL